MSNDKPTTKKELYAMEETELRKLAAKEQLPVTETTTKKQCVELLFAHFNKKRVEGPGAVAGTQPSPGQQFLESSTAAVGEDGGAPLQPGNTEVPEDDGSETEEGLPPSPVGSGLGNQDEAYVRKIIAMQNFAAGYTAEQAMQAVAHALGRPLTSEERELVRKIVVGDRNAAMSHASKSNGTPAPGEDRGAAFMREHGDPLEALATAKRDIKTLQKRVTDVEQDRDNRLKDVEKKVAALLVEGKDKIALHGSTDGLGKIDDLKQPGSH